MIRLPRNFFANLTLPQYREQLKLLPKFNDEKTKLYTMLGLTLAAMSFFGIFAINPTLSTIAELKRQYADLSFVNQKLFTKSQDLSALQEKYSALAPLLTVVYDAMPQKPEIVKFVAQVNSVLVRTHLEVRSLHTNGVEITPDRIDKVTSHSYFTFSLEAEGTYEDIIAFSRSLTRINRLVTVEGISISKDDKSNMLVLNLRGRQYFKP